MTVLFRDPVPIGSEPVLELPEWIRPLPPTIGRRSRYWHQPRSAFRRHDTGVLYVHFWCGPGRRVENEHDLTDDPPPDLRCGTCVGRRAGFVAVDGLIFTPRDHFTPTPRWCPGTTWAADRRTCAICGARVQAARGWNAWGSARHRPGPGLLERWVPCPFHGWPQMHERDGELVCSAWRCRDWWEA